MATTLRDDLDCEAKERNCTGWCNGDDDRLQRLAALGATRKEPLRKDIMIR